MPFGKKEWMVNVVPNVTSGHKTCTVRGKKQRCGKKPKYMVFNLDGVPKTSRFDSACCEKHLPRAIKLAYAENQEKAREEQERKIEQGS
jgi:hypothetical protein